MANGYDIFMFFFSFLFFFSSRRRHTRCLSDWSSDVCSSDLILARSVWNILVFMLNSLIFILIGLQLSGIVARLQGYTGRDLVTYALAISMIAKIGRASCRERV